MHSEPAPGDSWEISDSGDMTHTHTHTHTRTHARTHTQAHMEPGGGVEELLYHHLCRRPLPIQHRIPPVAMETKPHHHGNETPPTPPTCRDVV